ncbi:MAG: hypothetical protein COZ18_06705 [Flexibacter sp. CG_4_10_14_3_um_filter_32_15]|nr:MAG: hypothetical protein COZ18_06705 [Flexibacter sp. CG_4_10_14_3_um_filter_32_15]
MQDKVSKNAVELQDNLRKLVNNDDKSLSDYLDNAMYHLVCSSNPSTGLEEIQMTYQILYELKNIFVKMEKNIS